MDINNMKSTMKMRVVKLNFPKGTIMKRILYAFMCCLAILFSSCEKEVDLGYPWNITFTKDGGEKSITGDIPFTHAEIQDYNGNHGTVESGEDGKIYNIYDWLKIEYVELYNNALKIYAEPNTTGNQRTLYIELYSGSEYQIIKVTQM